MYVSLELLKNFIELEPEITPEDLAERLTFSGSEVESIIKPAEKLSGVVAARIDSIEKHPTENNLSVVNLNTGTGEYTCVTAAKNIKKGDMIFYARAGSILPNGQELGIKEFGGVQSNGMMLSAAELNLADIDDPTGLLILPSSARPGDDAKNLYHIGDVILDVSITPNRGDLLSLLGMAREIKGLYPKAVLKMPEWLRPVKQDREWSEKFNSISIPDNGCYAYRLGLATNAVMKSSPLTAKIDLVHMRMRPIVNAVDVTNYIMLMLGQPLHAFDLNTLPEREITVRAAHDGETMLTLDGKERLLTQKDMLITSGGQAVAIAGVMGGELTGINDDTKTIVIESASFSPVRVGHTSRRLGINSEAAFRFSRTVDPALSKTALMAASVLMRDWCGAEINYRPMSAENNIAEPEPVKLTRKKLSVYLSFDNMNAAAKILEGFGIKYLSGNNDEMRFMPPTWRPDIKIEEDLIEEIGRFNGYNDAPNKLPGELPRRADIGSEMSCAGFIRNILISRGYSEIVTYSFLPEDFSEKLLLDKNDIRSNPIMIANPISRDQISMRTTLIYGLLSALKNTLASGWREPVRIFEQGRIFLKPDNDLSAPNSHFEPNHLAGLIFNGSDNRSIWNDRAQDFYDIKSDLSALIKLRGYNPEFKAGHENFTHSGQTAFIIVDGVKVGFVARLKLALEQELNVEGIYIFEIDTEFLKDIKKRPFAPVSQFPASTRDISILVERDKNSEQVIDDIKTSLAEDGNNKILDSIRLFDVYSGKGIPENSRSLAFTITYRSRESTLKDNEVDLIHMALREKLKFKGYTIR